MIVWIENPTWTGNLKHPWSPTLDRSSHLGFAIDPSSHSIAVLLALVEAGLSRQPKDSIMLYSFATAQAAEVYAGVDRFRTGGGGACGLHGRGTSSLRPPFLACGRG